MIMRLSINLFFLILIATTARQIKSNGISEGNKNDGNRGITNQSDYNSSNNNNDVGTCSGVCGNTAGIIIGCILGGFVCAGLLCWSYRQCKAKQKINAYRKKYNQNRLSSISQQLYETKLNSFVEILKDVQAARKHFFFIRKEEVRAIEVQSIETLIKGEYDAQILLKGHDFYGGWEAQGGFVVTEKGPFFWMLKEYRAEQKVGLTKAGRTLVYQSTSFHNNVVEGKWFEQGQKQNLQSGMWKISLLSQNAIL